MRTMTIRPMTVEDVPAAAAISFAALPIPPEFDTPQRRTFFHTRTAYMLERDPGGCFASETDGVLDAFAISLVRDGIWGLSGIAVDPQRQAGGVGRRLLAATLEHGPARGGLICSSTDPKAMRLYATAGFDLRPCVGAGGIVDRSTLPSGLRSAPSDDLERAAAVSRAVRGGAYDVDDLALVTRGGGEYELLLHDRGFALHKLGSPGMLCALDDEAAADLLWSCLAASPNGGSIHVDFITAGQDWAVRTVLAARLALSPEGPIYTRGELGPLRPWLPSGAFL